MKKYLFFAAATLLLAACSNESDIQPDGDRTEIRLSSGLTVQQTGTRAGTDIQSAQFESGEKINVYISEDVTSGQTATTNYEQPLVYTAGSNGALTTSQQPYFPSSGNGVNIYALYPESAKTGEFSVQTDQSTDAAYKASDLMYGKPTQNPVARTSSAVNIGFNHLLSKVTVELEPGNGNPDLTGAEVSLIDVFPSIMLTADASSGTVGEATGTAGDITVMKVDANPDPDNISGSAIVPPQTLKPSFIEVKLANGGVLHSSNLIDDGKNSVTAVNLSGGKQHKFTITVNLTNLQVTSSITDWVGVAEYQGEAELQ